MSIIDSSDGCGSCAHYRKAGLEDDLRALKPFRYCAQHDGEDVNIAAVRTPLGMHISIKVSEHYEKPCELYRSKSGN